jgi:periplasmic nitrate reductase NapD
MRAELHIAGIVVQVLPQSVSHVAKSIAGLSGAQIHGSARDGKLVVTLEAASAREIAARMEDIHQLHAVLSASLVYQHNETLEAMMEEVTNDDHEAGIH